MDFKKVLEEWKNYQENKLVMANRFNCEVTRPGLTIMGCVTFTGSGEERALHFEDATGEVHVRVLLTNIIGTAPEGAVIRFHQHNGRTLLVRFPSVQVRRAAHRAWLRFEREEFGPTPPSSRENGSSSDD